MKLFKVIKILHREVGLPTISEFLKSILCSISNFSKKEKHGVPQRRKSHAIFFSVTICVPLCETYAQGIVSMLIVILFET
jgi:hypothetical protein